MAFFFADPSGIRSASVIFDARTATVHSPDLPVETRAAHGGGTGRFRVWEFEGAGALRSPQTLTLEITPVPSPPGTPIEYSATDGTGNAMSGLFFVAPVGGVLPLRAPARRATAGADGDRDGDRQANPDPVREAQPARRYPRPAPRSRRRPATRATAAAGDISSASPVRRLVSSTVPPLRPRGPTVIRQGRPIRSMVANLAPARSSRSS